MYIILIQRQGSQGCQGKITFLHNQDKCIPADTYDHADVPREGFKTRIEPLLL